MDGPVIPISTYEPRPRVRLTRTNTTALMSTEFPPIKWVVPYYVPEGLSSSRWGGRSSARPGLQWTGQLQSHRVGRRWARSHASKGTFFTSISRMDCAASSAGSRRLGST